MRSLNPRRMFGASLLVIIASIAPGLADTVFTPVVDFPGQVSATSATRGEPVYKGSKVVISGEKLIPGQEITLMRGPTVLNAAGPLVVDAEGKFSFELTVDADAATGQQPVLVIAEKPAAAEMITLKISPEIPISGTEKFAIANGPVTRGLYQVDYSEASKAVFVASAVGRPPVRQSALTKLDAETLAVLAQAEPPAAPAREDEDGGVFAVYGVGVDDANGTVWVTNSRQNTIAVYAQADLKLIKQFEPGAVNHARDVVIDEINGRAYASATRTGNIEVFDTRTLEQLAPIVITSAKRGGEYSAMSLDIDPASGKLFNVSMSTNELAVIDLKSGESRLIDLPGAKAAAGVAYDAKEGLIFVVSQQSDNLLIIDEASGEIKFDLPVGAQPLNVTFEPKSGLAYVANRGSGTIAVVNRKGEIVANLDAGNSTNQLRADGEGRIWAVNKARGENDPTGDNIWRITLAAE
ncbi:Vgb family protein [Pseudogemmobacter humi]|uniref:Virginiamycin B lyase n=1 Tax=Pseudogemmobacter humi TaxID=2483812 RepID=A0A3P5XRC0_9RHOB|nr:YncE family protein [Pseudogemmobacter humi]VDC33439.1 Virginiamycin B lyase [Pseudogemmobacter humi]